MTDLYQDGPQGWSKDELEEWCRGWTRNPATVLRAFIDAGLCSDEPSRREETRLSMPTALTASNNQRMREALEAADYYIESLEAVQARKVVRGLAEAKAGWNAARNALEGNAD